MTTADPLESVTVTGAVPTLGDSSVQTSAREESLADAVRRVSTCGPKLTLVTVADSSVETPTAR